MRDDNHWEQRAEAMRRSTSENSYLLGTWVHSRTSDALVVWRWHHGSGSYPAVLGRERGEPVCLL